MSGKKYFYALHLLSRINMSGKKYFYALGQSARARGFSKAQAEELYFIAMASDYARIAFDRGYRGM
jgi:hypothetical protein